MSLLIRNHHKSIFFIFFAVNLGGTLNDIHDIECVELKAKEKCDKWIAYIKKYIPFLWIIAKIMQN